ncbi:Hypothetical predicted protein [Mytilus galloprovincialis]|uniref:C-type lectin domain-containing protein n=1 Tax=Mytilus galloprovincialis TaxID=29158 RepID=A0A8B6D467_MYTGA|nr:Hypothetical predicted protein [Mytilus galloprovincialis]
MVIILCTIHVSTGERLTRNCLASNGRCGRKGLTCDNAFGKEVDQKGRCAMEEHVVNFISSNVWYPTSNSEQQGNNEDIWTGLYSPTSDENFEFVDAGGALTLDTLPFGERDQIDNEDCVEFELTPSDNWNWNDDPCDRAH